jgi:hypothetical protein
MPSTTRRLDRLATRRIEDAFVTACFSQKPGDWCGLHAAAEGFSLSAGAPTTHIHFYVDNVEAARALWRTLEPLFPEVFAGMFSYSIDDRYDAVSGEPLDFFEGPTAQSMIDKACGL